MDVQINQAAMHLYPLHYLPDSAVEMENLWSMTRKTSCLLKPFAYRDKKCTRFAPRKNLLCFMLFHMIMIHISSSLAALLWDGFVTAEFVVTSKQKANKFTLSRLFCGPQKSLRIHLFHFFSCKVTEEIIR
jgi:hypothetical protein